MWCTDGVLGVPMSCSDALRVFQLIFLRFFQQVTWLVRCFMSFISDDILGAFINGNVFDGHVYYFKSVCLS